MVKSLMRGHEFKSWLQILDGQFFILFFVKILLFD